MTKTDNASPYNVSLVLNTHTEGRAMQPTVRSLAHCIKHAIRHGLSVELVVVLDRPDEATITYVKSDIPKLIGSKVSIVIRETDCGDLGMARNFGIQIANGKYIGVLDADDLFGENIITECVSTLKKAGKAAVVHPEYLINFGVHDEYWRQQGSDEPNFDVAHIVGYNPWSSLSFASKNLRERYPYRATHVSKGFGPEDWQWNVDTYGDGVQHLIAPGTIYFYRRKVSSSLATAHNEHSLLFKSALLRCKEITPKKIGITNTPSRTIAQKLSIGPRLILSRVDKFIGPVLRKRRRTQLFEHYLRLAFSELFSVNAPPSIHSAEKSPLPKWVVDEWRVQHDFDHELFPRAELIANPQEYRPEVTDTTEVYWDIIKKLQLDPDYILLVPWLKTGGADLSTLNYIEAILKANPKAKITVIATELADSPWKDRLPQDVTFLTLSDKFHSLLFQKQTWVLGTLLVQAAAKNIHIINSSIGYRTSIQYGKSLSSISKIYISGFNIEIVAGRRTGHLLDYFSPLVDTVQRIFTDNEAIIDKLILWQALPRQKFSIHYQPYSGPIIKPRGKRVKYSSERPLNVLWAGRLDRQKRPDTLLAIAREVMDQGLPIHFHVYGSLVLDKTDIIKQFENVPNVTYHGPFSRGFGELKPSKYDAFLITSEGEGLPNILLEATGYGLPIIATKVGGIPEFIKNGETGYLIKQYEDVDEYIEALRSILDNPEQAYNQAVNAQKLLMSRHGWGAFMAQLKKDKYLGQAKTDNERNTSKNG